MHTVSRVNAVNARIRCGHLIQVCVTRATCTICSFYIHECMCMNKIFSNRERERERDEEILSVNKTTEWVSFTTSGSEPPRVANRIRQNRYVTRYSAELQHRCYNISHMVLIDFYFRLSILHIFFEHFSLPRYGFAHGLTMLADVQIDTRFRNQILYLIKVTWL